MSPILDVTEAPTRLLANKSVTPGHCLEYVSRAIRNGRQPLIWAGLDTALNCWNMACGDKHASRDIPRGFPGFLGANRFSKAGDTFVSLGGGRLAVTDYPGWGVVGICTLEQREAQTGRKYLGYAGEFLGYTLTNTATASLNLTPIAVQEEDDDMRVYTISDGGLSGTIWGLAPGAMFNAKDSTDGLLLAAALNSDGKLILKTEKELRTIAGYLGVPDNLIAGGMAGVNWSLAKDVLALVKSGGTTGTGATATQVEQIIQASEGRVVAAIPKTFTANK